MGRGSGASGYNRPVTRADRYPLALLGLFTVVWALLAIAPWYRQDWLLENLLVFIVVPVLALTARKLRFSNFAYTCLFAFFVLHEIGAHYTYSEVPWREGLQALGVDASRFAGRNHYDRLVHFCYGLLMLPRGLGALPAAGDAKGNLALHPARDVHHGALGALRTHRMGGRRCVRR